MVSTVDISQRRSCEQAKANIPHKGTLRCSMDVRPSAFSQTLFCPFSWGHPVFVVHLTEEVLMVSILKIVGSFRVGT